MVLFGRDSERRKGKKRYEENRKHLVEKAVRRADKDGEKGRGKVLWFIPLNLV